jgi:hypothetical protein
MGRSPRDAVAQQIKKFPAFYGTQRFITVFTIPHHWKTILSQMIPFHILKPYFFEIHLTLSSYLCFGLQSGLFHSGIPTEILYAILIAPMHSTWTAHLTLLDMIILTISGEEEIYKL